MYTDGELQRYNQICLQGMDNSSTDIVVAYPSRTADAIAKFLAEVYIEFDASQQKESMMNCLVNMQLPSKDKWIEACTKDKDTTYISSRLKSTKEW